DVVHFQHRLVIGNDIREILVARIGLSLSKVVRNIAVAECRAEAVFRPAGYEAREDNAGVNVSRNQAPRLGAAGDTSENADVLVLAALPYLLVDDGVKAMIVLEDGGIQKFRRVVIKLLPSTELERAGQIADVILELTFEHQQRRIFQAELDAVAVVRLRVFGERISRGSIEDGRKDRQVIRRRVLHANAERSQRIARSACRHVGSRNAGPTKCSVEKQRGAVADEEFAIGGERADADFDLVLEQGLLEPKFKSPERFQALDIAPRENVIHAFRR